ncbi:leucine rich repeat LRR-containing protein [Nitzschia inconspicua]|uniref:Leucine rich repeat LRR-containing protein n=1 Tax=Nitzschia inconspicua TaxID=303405 RepID=A0A9K3PMC7_9STRA|nr:leucine rich repeat LRR-containing protein [Nitzschia inconspicua]
MSSPAFPSSSSISSVASSIRRTLSFRKSNGSLADVEEILQTLRRDGSSVTEIFCEDIGFGDRHVVEMETILKEYHRSIRLTKLELPSNGLTRAAGRTVALILHAQYETLLRLNLSKNSLQSYGLNGMIEPLTRQLQPSRLVHLDLTETQLGARAAPMLASLIRNNRSIQTLLLSNNQLGTKTIKLIAPELTNNPTLQTLDLSYNSINHKGASMLAKALVSSTNSRSTLKVLDISGNKIASHGMQTLCEVLVTNRTIEELKCGANKIGQEGAAFMANVLKFNYTLRILNLHSNDIGPWGASLLMDALREHNRTLKSISLAWNNIDSVVAKEMAQVLAKNDVLKDVDLMGNNIASDGVSSLASSLFYNLSLDKLNLMNNKFDHVGAFALTDAVGRPTCPLLPQNLLWEDNSAIGDEGVISLTRIAQLRYNREQWLDQLIRDIANDRIHSVDLSHRNIGDEELLLLVDALVPENGDPLPLFRSMMIGGHSLRPRSLVPLVEACIPSPANVMRLYLKNCDNLGDDTMEAIVTCLPRAKSLQVLCLFGCGLTSSSAKRLAKGLKGNTSLRRLNLDCNTIGDVGLMELASVLPHETLESLSVNENGITDTAMRSYGLTTIQELHLKKNRITNNGALSFAQTLGGGSSRLTWISLQGNEVTRNGAEVIQLFLPDGRAAVDY